MLLDIVFECSNKDTILLIVLLFSDMKTFQNEIKSFGFWNVHGLGSKLEDSDFLSHVKKFDFFSLLETWSTENTIINIPNYSYFHQHRQKS